MSEPNRPSICVLATALCAEIEKIAPGDQQKTVSILARILSQRIRETIHTLESSEAPFYDAMKSLGATGIQKP